MSAELQLAFQLTNTSENGKKKLKEISEKKGITILEDEDSNSLFLFPINEVIGEVFEKSISELEGDETRVGLDWIDIDSGSVYESNLSSKIEDIEFFDKTGDIFDIPKILSFINGNPEEVKGDRDEIIAEYNLTVSNPPEEIPENESMVENSTDSEQIPVSDNSSISEEIPEEDEGLSEEEIEEMFQEEPEEDFEPTSKREGKSSIESEDPIYKVAKTIFEEKTLGDKLPKFDEKAKELIHGNIIESETSLQDAKNKSITSIYEKIKSSNDEEYKEALDSSIADARKASAKNIKQLEINRDAKLSQVKADEEKAYETKKKEAGAANLKDFYAKYDAEHLPEVEKLITSKSKPILDEFNRESEAESKNLNDYEEQVKDAIFNHVKSNTDVSSIIDNYRKVLNQEKDFLLKKAKEKKTENHELKNQVNQLSNQLEIEQKTYDSRVAAETAQKTNEQSYVFKKQVEEADKKRLAAEKESRETKKKLEKQSEQFAELMEKLNNMADKSPTYLTPQPQPQQPIVQPPVQTDSKEEIKQGKTKPINKYIKWGAALLVVMGLSSVGTLAVSNLSHPQQSAAVVTSSQSQSTSSETQGDKVPSTFTYTDKDGKKYAVIKDDDNSGHYVDSKGKTHTVIFNSK